MTEFKAGMMVSQRAIDWWPYLAHVIKRVNDAGEVKNIEELTDVFIDAAKFVANIRHDVTVNTLKEDFRKDLQRYRSQTRSMVRKRQQLQNPHPVGKSGKALAASTLKQYELALTNWPKLRENWKTFIRNQMDELEAFSITRGKIFTRGKVSLKLIYGGRYPAKLSYFTQQKEWQQIR